MSIFSCFSCRCCSRDHLEICSELTKVWPTKNKVLAEEKLNSVFKEPQIKFFGFYEEGLKNKSIDLSLINKKGVKKIVMGKAHTLFLFCKLKFNIY